MNSEVKVSVIIPVYNVENYLSECLDSIIGQTLKDIEIICIEDCSTDYTYDILKKYAGDDSRIRIYENKANSGPSYTRNRGLCYAKGKYIYFMDSDDALDRNALLELYEESEKNNLDVVLFEAEVVWNGKQPDASERPYQGNRKGSYNGVFSGKELIKKLLINGDMDSCVPLQFWNKDFLLKNNFGFKENELHEDLIFSFRAIFSTKRAMVISKKYYTYYRRSNSITGSCHAEKSIEGYTLAYLEVLKLKDQFDRDEEMVEAVIPYLDSLEWEIRRYYREGVQSQGFSSELIQDRIARYISRSFLYGMENEYLNFIPKEKMDIIKQCKEVIIYGAGLIAHDVIKILSVYDVVIHKVVVSEKNAQQCICGHKIWAIDGLNAQDKHLLVLVCVGRKYHDQIVEILQKKKFERVLYVLPDLT